MFGMQNSGQMTPEQIQAMMRKREQLRQQIVGGPMPTDVGGGIARLGQAFAYRAMGNQMGGFPNAPQAQAFPQAPQPAPQQPQLMPAMAGNMPQGGAQIPAQVKPAPGFPAAPQGQQGGFASLLGNIFGFGRPSGGGGLY